MTNTPETKDEAQEVIAGTIPLYSVISGDTEHKKRLRFELGLPTMDPKLRQAIENEQDSRLIESETRETEHKSNAKKGGAASVQSRRSDLAPRNIAIANKARKLMAPPSKRAPCEICSILKDDDIAQGLSTKQIRTILQDEGVLEKRRK